MTVDRVTGYLTVWQTGSRMAEKAATRARVCSRSDAPAAIRFSISLSSQTSSHRRSSAKSTAAVVVVVVLVVVVIVVEVSTAKFK